MEQKLEVEILPGKHSRPAPNGTRESFENLLKNAGIKKGVFKILLGKQIRGGCEAKRILIHNIDEKTNAILIKAQINGKKDQRFEFFLTLPNQFRQKPEVFFGALEKGADLINNPVESIAVNCEGEKELNNQEKEKLEEPKVIKKRRPRGLGFSHFVADEESIYIFWLEIKEFFKENEGVNRRKLTEDFLSDYGHTTSCYRFVAELLRLKIFAETSAIKGSRRLVVGEKLRKIINKFENKNSRKHSTLEPEFFSEIEKLRNHFLKKREIEEKINSKKSLIQKTQMEIEDLSRQITSEMNKAEQKLNALRSIL